MSVEHFATHANASWTRKRREPPLVEVRDDHQTVRTGCRADLALDLVPRGLPLDERPWKRGVETTELTFEGVDQGVIAQSGMEARVLDRLAVLYLVCRLAALVQGEPPPCRDVRDRSPEKGDAG